MVEEKEISQEENEVEESEETTGEGELSFEELLEQSEASTLNRVSAGQKITGKVIMLSGDNAFIDIGMRSEAVLPLENAGDVELNEGDDVDVFVVSPKGQVTLSLEPVMGHGDIGAVETAYEEGKPVEGKVVKTNAGGYEVNVDGVRCFCPHSQIDLRQVKDPSTKIGKTMMFKVIECDGRSKNVVLSRRALLDAERKEKMEETRKLLEIGAVLEGRVADIQSFGAFVDLGGIHGLVHISELAYNQVEKVEDVLSVGETVKVKVLDMTFKGNKERISLSIKALLPNPWDTLGFQVGDLIEGVVARKSGFGIFINLAAGIDGLLPRRMMKKAGQNVEMEEFQEGQAIEVEVVEIDSHNRKIALALPGWNEEMKSDIREGDELTAEVIKVLPVGILVQGIDDPAKGLIHKRTLRGGTMKKIAGDFPPGMQVQVILSERDSQGRLNFVLKGDEEHVDQATLNEFSGKQADDLAHNPFASFFKENQ